MRLKSHSPLLEGWEVSEYGDLVGISYSKRPGIYSFMDCHDGLNHSDPKCSRLGYQDWQRDSINIQGEVKDAEYAGP